MIPGVLSLGFLFGRMPGFPCLQGFPLRLAGGHRSLGEMLECQVEPLDVALTTAAVGMHARNHPAPSPLDVFDLCINGIPAGLPSPVAGCRGHEKHYGAVVTNQLFTVMDEDEFGGHGMLPCSVPGSISLSQSGAFGGAAGTGCPSCRLCSVAANRHAPI